MTVTGFLRCAGEECVVGGAQGREVFVPAVDGVWFNGGGADETAVVVPAYYYVLDLFPSVLHPSPSLSFHST